MTEHEVRAPHEIITDLLGFVGCNHECDEEEIARLIEEAEIYLAKVQAEKAAWGRLDDMSRDVFGGRNCRLRYDPGL